VEVSLSSLFHPRFDKGIGVQRRGRDSERVEDNQRYSTRAENWKTRKARARARGLDDDDDDDHDHDEEDEDDSPRFSCARDRSTTDTRFGVTPAVPGHRKLLNCGSRTVVRSCGFSTDRIQPSVRIPPTADGIL